jgi:pimeloyl-ACP methyl ester carboxylesterase
VDFLQRQRFAGAGMISNTADSRELIALNDDGVLLHATYHIERRDQAGPQKKVAVVFLNSLFSPRSLIGDTAVHLATAFAARGYPSFRLDLPGLGDTYGEIPNDLLKFTNDGGFANVGASKVHELVTSRGLPGVVIFGHCAGAASAIYAAASCKDCRGLILTDPTFNLPKGIAASLYPELVNWARQSEAGAILGAAYDAIRELTVAGGKKRLPPNANLMLISRFKRVVATGIPVLILRSSHPLNSHRRSGFDYLAYVLSFAIRQDQISAKAIEETDHSFANRAGRMAVLQNAEAWLDRNSGDMETRELLSEARYAVR